MLDPRLPKDIRLASGALVAAAVAFLAVAALLTYWGIDWRRNGCGCDESLYPDWAWLVVVGLAGASALVAVLLAFRARSLKADG